MKKVSRKTAGKVVDLFEALKKSLERVPMPANVADAEWASCDNCGKLWPVDAIRNVWCSSGECSACPICLGDDDGGEQWDALERARNDADERGGR